MNGGLVKRITKFALVAAAASMLFCNWSFSVKAADLGGDCCADLEERVAELEATTVRKGNRKVSLELSGQVDKALLAWNDGKMSDVYVVDNNYSSTRFRMKGTGQMTPGWRAGFFMEYEFRDSSSNLVDQTTEQNRNLESALRIRQENVYVESERFGRITIGQQNTATKDLVLINLGGGMSDPENYYASSFFLRDNTLGPSGSAGPTANALPNSTRTVSPSLGTTAPTITATPPVPATTFTSTIPIIGYSVGGLNWGNLANALDSQRMEVVRYDTPSIFGFIASASWGENDFWDAALRYQKEWNSIRVAGGVGYAWWGERSLTNGAQFGTNTFFTGNNNSNQPSPTAGPSGDTSATQVLSNAGQIFGGATTGTKGTKIEVVSGDISVLHVPTGLYATFVAAVRSFTNTPDERFNKDASYFYIQAGITKRFFDVGATTFYGEFGNYDNFGAGATYFQTFNLIGTPNTLTKVFSSNVDRWGAGFTQAFDGAALELYANYIHYQAEIKTENFLGAASLGQNAVPGTFVSRPVQDWDAFYTGARLKF